MFVVVVDVVVIVVVVNVVVNGHWKVCIFVVEVAILVMVVYE